VQVTPQGDLVLYSGLLNRCLMIEGNLLERRRNVSCPSMSWICRGVLHCHGPSHPRDLHPTALLSGIVQCN
jgi:hypothetical protein